MSQTKAVFMARTVHIFDPFQESLLTGIRMRLESRVSNPNMHSPALLVSFGVRR